MSAQPKALRIANECEQSADEWRNEVDTRMQAAAELRRLHAENEAKDSLLRQAVEALECLSEHGHRCNRCDSEVDEGGKLEAAARDWLEGR